MSARKKIHGKTPHIAYLDGNGFYIWARDEDYFYGYLQKATGTWGKSCGSENFWPTKKDAKNFIDSITNKDSTPKPQNDWRVMCHTYEGNNLIKDFWRLKDAIEYMQFALASGQSDSAIITSLK